MKPDTGNPNDPMQGGQPPWLPSKPADPAAWPPPIAAPPAPAGPLWGQDAPPRPPSVVEGEGSAPARPAGGFAPLWPQAAPVGDAVAPWPPAGPPGSAAPPWSPAAPPWAPRPQPRRKGRKLAIAAVAILGVAALVAALLLGSQSRDRGRRLKSAQQQVTALRQQLSSAQKTATDAANQRDLVKQQLDDTKKAGQDLTTQNNTLKSCLTDIRAGDIAAAANDQKGVDAADQKAAADCPKADVLLGPTPPTA
jgi:type II secretory pathway pseudopilin PulG